MVNDDPFGLSDEAARTRFQPLERRAPAQAAPEPPAAPRGSRAHPNRLIAAFGPLLEAAPALQTERPPEDVGALRGRLQKELVEARDAAIGRGVPASLTDKGLWCVAALVDDIVLNTPWGAHGDWARRSIVAELFGQVDAGERFFDRLDATERQAARDGELLELMYLCLSLGFRGKFRVREAQERRGLEELRGGVARMIRRPELADRPLAPRWQGIDAPDADPRFIVPLWVVGVTALALLIAIYAGLAFRLGGEVEALPSMAGAILPAERAVIYRPAKRPDPVQPVGGVSVIELLPAIEAAVPQGMEDAMAGRESTSLVTLVLQHTNPELFRSGSADLTRGYDQLVAAIAGVLVESEEIIGQIRVVGHTDSIRVGALSPFGSNQGLSEARAKTVIEHLEAAGVARAAMSAEGRAASEPVQSNSTAAGRAANRRIEIHIEKRV